MAVPKVFESGVLTLSTLTGSEYVEVDAGYPNKVRATTQKVADLSKGVGNAGTTFTDGSTTVAGANNLTITGGAVGGAAPNATLTIPKGIEITDGVTDVAAVTKITVTGASVGGAAPNATLTVNGVSVLQAKVDLTAAQLKALHTSPQTIIAAPGVGKFLNILGVTWLYSYGSAAFTDGSGDTQLCFGSLANGKIGDTLTEAVLTGGAAAFVSYVPSLATGFVTVAHATNVALLLTGSADMAAGDGTATLIVTYTINPTT